jgi:hypothetical protein
MLEDRCFRFDDNRWPKVTRADPPALREPIATKRFDLEIRWALSVTRRRAAASK